MELMSSSCRTIIFFPLGAWRWILLCPEKRHRLGQPVAAMMCMGPVSLPMASFACFAKAAISKSVVFPVKLTQEGHSFVIWFVISNSEFVPSKTGVMPSEVRWVAICA